MPMVQVEARVRLKEWIEDEQGANKATQYLFLDYIPRKGEHLWLREQLDFGVVRNVYYFPTINDSPHDALIEIDVYVYRVGLGKLIESGEWQPDI